VLELPVADDLADAVHGAWATAAIEQRNAEWARALWPLTHTPRLLTLLPPTEAEALAAAAPNPVEIARELEWPWSIAFSRTIIQAIPGYLKQQWRQRLDFAGARLDPSLAEEVEALRDLGVADVRHVCDQVAARAAMLAELA
jgi:hypothetical protein